MAVDLVFGRAPHTTGPVDLVFGAGTDAPPADPLAAHATIVLGGLAVQALALYDNRNPRRASAAIAAQHQPATAVPGAGLATGWAPAGALATAPASRWQPAAPAAAERSAAWVVSTRTGRTAASAWELAARAAQQLAMVHQAALQLRAQAAGRWQVAAAVVAQSTGRHGSGRAAANQSAVAWRTGLLLQAQATGRHGAGVAAAAVLLAPWQVARVVPPGREVWPPVDPNARPPREISTHLVFTCPPWAGGPVHLVFGRVCSAPGPAAGFVIAPARFYMAIHSLVAHRLPDLTEIPIYDLRLSADVGSFGWTFSASAPVSAFDALAPSSGLPAQVRFTLDGLTFAFLVDSLQRSEEFGRRSVRFAGRSVTALLARPYARESTRGNASAAATAQQLAEQALDLTDVALDWGLTDWLVPAGAWSHSGTPLAAVQAIVEAAGGYLQSHRSAATLLARHPYPELAGGLPGGPWNWYAPGVVPDVQLAPDAIITSAIERRDGADINAVYVSGVSQGVLARVKRAASAGDKLASLVTDSLITAQEVALQRGLSVLGAAGPKHLVTRDLPVLTGAGQPGVLDVGQLVQVDDAVPWRGRVRSINVNVRMPFVRQSAQIERHLEVA